MFFSVGAFCCCSQDSCGDFAVQAAEADQNQSPENLCTCRGKLRHGEWGGGERMEVKMYCYLGFEVFSLGALNKNFGG